MKILILSDIHGNLHALECVLKRIPHDFVLCCGDLVMGYPFAEECIGVIRHIGDRVCMGNHDFVIAHDRKFSPQLHNKYAHLAAELDRSANLTRQCIGESDKSYLQNLPREHHFEVEDVTFYMNHTIPGFSLHHYLPPDTSEQKMIDYYDGIQADILITGHTHIPYVKKIGPRRLINPGSVGEPRDGDPRACFAVFDTSTGQVELNRLTYDTSETLRVLSELAYPKYLAHCLTHGSLPAC